uniref:Stigma-specific Stig1 family protein n=1 Tax=Kalanchoe fedtschenkoi TaxID=63787 RepID=A0A7N0RF90_KALFE
MKCLMFWLMLGIVVTMSLALSATDSELPLSSNESDGEHDDEGEEGEEVLGLLRGPGRSLLSHHHHHDHHKKKTCNKYPRICWKRGSPGRACCKKKCVNVFTDRRNCGWCGHKCRFSEICCKGKCVNPKWDKRHCGGCNVKCKKGRKCEYGMCSYA